MRAKKTKSGKWRCQLYIGDETVNGKRKVFSAKTQVDLKKKIAITIMYFLKM